MFGYISYIFILNFFAIIIEKYNFPFFFCNKCIIYINGNRNEESLPKILAKVNQLLFFDVAQSVQG